jgi:hypothetical protein
VWEGGKWGGEEKREKKCRNTGRGKVNFVIKHENVIYEIKEQGLQQKRE